MFFRPERITFHRHTEGQAMAEFCVVAPLLVLLLWSIWYVSDLYIVKHKTLVAARYGSWLLSRYDDLPPDHAVSLDDVRALIALRFFDNNTDGLTVEQPQGERDLSDQFGGVVEDNSTMGEWVQNVVDFLSTHIIGADTPPVYQVVVTKQFPRVFGAVDLREDSQDYFNIRSEHSVLGNCWDGARTENHELIGVAEDAIGDLLSGVPDMIESLGSLSDILDFF